MTKCVATGVVCSLPLLLMACPNESPCARLGNNIVVEVVDSSQTTEEDIKACNLPPAFLLGALGCTTAVMYSADACLIDYKLLCPGGAEIDIEVTQELDDRVVGILHKYDPRRQCTLDLEVMINPAPTSTPTDEDESS